jgi:hypothetical protein
VPLPFCGFDNVFPYGNRMTASSTGISFVRGLVECLSGS